MKTIKALRREQILAMVYGRVSEVNDQINNLKRDFEDSKMPACKARREYAPLREKLAVLMERRSRLEALDDEQKLGEKRVSATEILSAHDEYFA